LDAITCSVEFLRDMTVGLVNVFTRSTKRVLL